MTEKAIELGAELLSTQNPDYMKFQIPGVPYSQVNVPFVDEDEGQQLAIDKAVLDAKSLKLAFDGAFPQAEAPQSSTAAAQRPSQQRATPSQQRQPAGGGSRVTDENPECPDCGNKATYSIEKYQQWERHDDGLDYAQKFFCANDDCNTKSLWRSQVVLAVRGADSENLDDVPF